MSKEKQLHLDVAEQRMPDSVQREVTLRADGEADEISIHYDVLDTTVGDIVVLDGFLQGVLFHCMRRGLPVRIHGNISESAVHNLHEFQRAWVCWKPRDYEHVDLVPDAVVKLAPSADNVMQAFSGGVDASFTLVSNKFLLAERGGYDIQAALLVHGFDVSYENTEGFDKLVERARRTLESVGAELRMIRTNSRMLNIQSWGDSYALQLTACLHQFSDRFGTALVGSSEPYDALWLPVGANPITDHLLSGDRMRIVHDGAAFSRTEKVEAIAGFPAVVDELKVCWAGAVQHANCGACEKCLRTRLNFAASGHDEPSCFPGPFEQRMLRKLRARTPVQLAELEGILSYIRRRGLSYAWAAALRRRILLSWLTMPLEQTAAWKAFRRRLRSALRAAAGKAPQPHAGTAPAASQPRSEAERSAVRPKYKR